MSLVAACKTFKPAKWLALIVVFATDRLLLGAHVALMTTHASVVVTLGPIQATLICGEQMVSEIA